ncbi:MAG: acetolactate decarboxylase [Dehalococcoidales bacterium]|nr:acetolactate decarboxylase [Dehalococcoidales bacterium]
MSKYQYCLLSLLALLLVFTGCSADNSLIDAGERDTLVQVSTFDALLAGNYDGVTEMGDLRKYGDFGIGTLDGLDGELIVLDGKFYDVRADGVAYAVTDTTTTPFASVTFFDIDREETLASGLSFADFQTMLDKMLPTDNLFYAIKIEGTFSYVKTRSVPAQEKPYPPLAEVTQNQPTFEFHDISGTIVGFRCPPYVTGINVTGYHLHFLTADKQAGGHLLDFTVAHAKVMVDNTYQFLMLLPGEGSDFYKEDLSVDRQGEAEQVEK